MNLLCAERAGVSCVEKFSSRIFKLLEYLTEDSFFVVLSSYFESSTVGKGRLPRRDDSGDHEDVAHGDKAALEKIGDENGADLNTLQEEHAVQVRRCLFRPVLLQRLPITAMLIAA